MLKKQLINYNLFLKVILIFFLLFKTTLADIIKPSINIEPEEVVKIQLSALMKNDFPNKDSGIVQTWEFAHPNNKMFTGPLERFKEMIKGESYKMLLNHNSHEVLEIFKDKRIAIYEVVIFDKKKNYYKFKWQVEKYEKQGPLENCWLTTVVSQPIPINGTA